MALDLPKEFRQPNHLIESKNKFDARQNKVFYGVIKSVSDLLDTQFHKPSIENFETGEIIEKCFKMNKAKDPILELNFKELGFRKPSEFRESVIPMGKMVFSYKKRNDRGNLVYYDIIGIITGIETESRTGNVSISLNRNFLHEVIQYRNGFTSLRISEQVRLKTKSSQQLNALILNLISRKLVKPEIRTIDEWSKFLDIQAKDSKDVIRAIQRACKELQKEDYIRVYGQCLPMKTKVNGKGQLKNTHVKIYPVLKHLKAEEKKERMNIIYGFLSKLINGGNIWAVYLQETKMHDLVKERQNFHIIALSDTLKEFEKNLYEYPFEQTKRALAKNFKDNYELPLTAEMVMESERDIFS